MGVLDGFYRTWSNARSTFGEGTPWGGESFDASPMLRQLQSNLVGAKPSSQWSGSAADSYSTANDKQAHVLGEMANLDQRLRAEVDRSASVVSAGRRDLETGLDRWQPIDIKDIYAIQVDNPRLPLYVPNPFGGQVMLDPKRPAVSAG
ncbi:EspA/EspE family type VII secretion system effector [Mycolicibacterium sp. YH-1]|uniref:EspA/EspE family type VII secretion system effector n=1 Tax=Mycolicibacterium sp. YH-1 TaxID=2908837 RepID=UPI001F4C1A3B|nr:EspA/EspE family type VII secretion system effector [Mycolicibacterium sp. YH-1]UNB54831.1 hypothetical protein L0M16_11230 [Mycolicibacterium sp. YH-1]